MTSVEPAPARVVGNYVLRSEIGRGASSEVYAGEHQFLGEPVAIKLLRPGDPDAGESFLAEATRTRTIEHPNVVRVLDCGRDDASGRYFLVMERVAGTTLAVRLCEGALAEPAARSLFAQIADGMQAVHDAGIVHRDLKPGNVMLGERSKIVAKIIDLGIAKFLGSAGAAITTRRIGTPAYMAPEQMTGGLIAPCTDVWAFGVMLFEAVTGRLPFPDVRDGRCPQLFETAPRAADHAAISPALSRLIACCLERDPGKRPATMAEVARMLRSDDELDRITQDAGAIAGPPVPPQRSRRALHWLVAGGAAIALGITGALIFRASQDAVGAPAGLVPAAPVASPDDKAAANEQAPSASTAAAANEPDAHPSAAAPPSSSNDPAAGTSSTAAHPSATTKLEIRSTPSGAEIVVDGRRRGTTPRVLELAAPTSIVVRRAGYRAARVRVDAAALAKSSPIDIRLVPLPRPSKARKPQPRETLD